MGRIPGDQLPQHRHAVVRLADAELNLGEHHQQRRIAAGDLGCQVLPGALQVPAFQERSRQRLAQLAVGRIEQHGAALHFDRLVVSLPKRQRFGERLELRGGCRALGCVVEVVGRGIDVEELGAHGLVVRLKSLGLAQRVDGVLVTGCLGELGRNRADVAHGSRHVVDVDARLRAFNSRGDVGCVDAAEDDAGLRRAALIAGGAPFLDDDIEVGARVREELLARHEIRSLHQRVLVIRLELDDLLVDRRGFHALSFFVQRVGDLDEPLDRFVDLTGARVQIAQRIGGAPVGGLVCEDAQVLCNGSFDLPLSKLFFSVSEGSVAIE